MTTHLCYTLEEAAVKLNLSETVLVRLSQYFKMPRSAYEAVGYLSFKGDLAFTEQDMTFFMQAKERLLAGESLEAVKSRMREDSVALKTSGPSSYASVPKPEQSKIMEPLIPASSLMGQPLRKIEDQKPYEKAVAQSFERYKSIHRPGLGKVFENLLKEIGTFTGRAASPTQETPTLGKNALATNPLADNRQKPSKISSQSPLTSSVEAVKPSSSQQAGGDKHQGEPLSWHTIIQDASSRPRTLNNQLKHAAILLREQALGERTSSRKSQSER